MIFVSRLPFQRERRSAQMQLLLLLLSTETVFIDFRLFFFVSLVKVELWKIVFNKMHFNYREMICTIHINRRLSTKLHSFTANFPTFYYYFSNQDNLVTFLRSNISTANENFIGKFSAVIMKSIKWWGGERYAKLSSLSFSRAKAMCAFCKCAKVFQFGGEICIVCGANTYIK